MVSLLLLIRIFVLVRLKMLCGLFNVLSRKVRESCIVVAVSFINLLFTASTCGSLESAEEQAASQVSVPKSSVICSFLQHQVGRAAENVIQTTSGPTGLSISQASDNV